MKLKLEIPKQDYKQTDIQLAKSFRKQTSYQSRMLNLEKMISRKIEQIWN